MHLQARHESGQRDGAKGDKVEGEKEREKTKKQYHLVNLPSEEFRSCSLSSARGGGPNPKSS